MKPDLARLDAAIAAAKNLRAAQVDYQRKSDRARDAGMDCSPAKRGNLSASMSAAAMDVERQWDTLHAALVDLGICPAKDVAAYAERTQHLSGFHDVAYQPAIPATCKDYLIVPQHPRTDGGGRG
jgi:hypothetical protein